jgi:hypothetical protein
MRMSGSDQRHRNCSSALQEAFWRKAAIPGRRRQRRASARESITKITIMRTAPRIACAADLLALEGQVVGCGSVKPGPRAVSSGFRNLFRPRRAPGWDCATVQRCQHRDSGCGYRYTGSVLRRIISTASLLVCLSPLPAFAQEDVQAASAAFAEAQRAQLRGDFPRAAELFEIADQAAPSPAALRSAIRNLPLR